MSEIYGSRDWGACYPGVQIWTQAPYDYEAIQEALGGVVSSVLTCPGCEALFSSDTHFWFDGFLLDVSCKGCCLVSSWDMMRLMLRYGLDDAVFHPYFNYVSSRIKR